MTSIKRSTTLSLACGALLALALGSVAFATHARVGGGTPFRVPLVIAFNACGTLSPEEAANGDAPAMAITNQHVTPLTNPSCAHSAIPPGSYAQKTDSGNPPTLTGGASTLGSVRLDVINAAAGGAPEDISIAASAGSGVLCVAGPASGPHGSCTAAGAGYHGFLLANSIIRITDHSNDAPPGGPDGANNPCPVGGGAPPCVTGTVEDLTFTVPLLCGAFASLPAGTCAPAASTINTLKPGTVKELQRGNVEIQNVRVMSPGANLSFGASCPPTCGDTDDDKYMSQGIFLP